MRKLRLIMAIVGLVLIAFIGILYYTQKNLPYENGRYFDPSTEIVYHEQNMEVYGWMFYVGLLSIVVYLVYRCWPKRS